MGVVPVVVIDNADADAGGLALFILGSMLSGVQNLAPFSLCVNFSVSLVVNKLVILLMNKTHFFIDFK